MSYATYDFEESLQRTELKPSDVAIVLGAWGKGDGQGDDAGHYRWATEGVTEWSGGFLMRLIDGRFAYLTGWCDYTGWGCQDGVELKYFDALPQLGELREASEYHKEPTADEWDQEPADLNRWLEVARAADAVDPVDGETNV